MFLRVNDVHCVLSTDKVRHLRCILDAKAVRPMQSAHKSGKEKHDPSLM